MLGQALSRRNEGPLPERCFVGSFQVDLFQLSQIVIGRCAGYVKVGLEFRVTALLGIATLTDSSLSICSLIGRPR